jgi:hypothetical protein
VIGRRLGVIEKCLLPHKCTPRLAYYSIGSNALFAEARRNKAGRGRNSLSLCQIGAPRVLKTPWERPNTRGGLDGNQRGGFVMALSKKGICDERNADRLELQKHVLPILITLPAGASNVLVPDLLLLPTADRLI